ncbi:hypothetical protein HMPREF1575_01390, partial [Gardnerella vaginalis JCP7672]
MFLHFFLTSFSRFSLLQCCFDAIQVASNRHIHRQQPRVSQHSVCV